MVVHFFVFACVLLCALILWRVVHVVRCSPSIHRHCIHPPLTVCVVLGSGGHTSEMVRAIRGLSLDMWRATRPFYIASATDMHSAKVASIFESSQLRRYCRLHTIPRAREVGQSYFTSAFSTLHALWASIRIIKTERPDVILVNGPGVCVPVVAAALLLAAFSPPRYYRRPSIAYMESYTCVSHLSLSGRLLAPFCDVLTVQWQKIYDICQTSSWGTPGRLYFVGPQSGPMPPDAPRLMAHLALAPPSGEAFAIVTVGSTQFDGLIEEVDDEEICRVLAQRGITRLLIQQGTSSRGVRLRSAHGVSVEAFAFRPNLHEVIQKASLVISHAGAGTILEALEYKRPLVVVPNRALMSDHQLELAEALSEANYLFCMHLGSLSSQLATMNLDQLRVFPGLNEVGLREALRPLLGL